MRGEFTLPSRLPMPRIVLAPSASGKSHFIRTYGRPFVDGDFIVSDNTGWVVDDGWDALAPEVKQGWFVRWARDVAEASRMHQNVIPLVNISPWLFMQQDILAIVLIDEAIHRERARARKVEEPDRYDVLPGLSDDRKVYEEYIQTIVPGVGPPVLSDFDDLLKLVIRDWRLSRRPHAHRCSTQQTCDRGSLQRRL